MTKQTSKVLVLGSDTRSFLTVIRSLGRAGKEVHVAWCSRNSLAKTSRYVSQVHDLDRPPASSWLSQFRELLGREQFNLVIPCNDPSILPLHQQREALSDYPIYLVNADIFDTVMDKAAVNEIAAEVGLKLPAEVVVRSMGDIDRIEQLRPPYVLKPTQSFTAGRLSSKNHVLIVQDLSSARRQVEAILDRTSVAVQEYFEGHGVGVEFLAKDGEILMSFQHRRLHEPPDGGGSSYRKSCKVDPQLGDATTALVKSLGYSGVGMAEYRYDFKRNDWIFVELNSRFWGSLPLAVACGANFPLYLYDLLCDGRRDFPRDYKVNRTARNWMMDVRWLGKTVAANGMNLPGQLGLAWQLVAELRYALTLRESCDAIAWDDTAPGVNEIKEALLEIPQKIKRKVFRIKAGVVGFRNWTRRRLQKKLQTASTLMFVCKGNICRSPFAERYLLGKTNQFKRLDSCGYFPKSGRPSPENAAIAASQFGVELSPHRSAEISAAALESSDVIFVFDYENYHTVRSQFPRAKSKVFLLSWINEESPGEIEDPYGGSVEDFKLTYDRIGNALDSLVT